MNKTFDVEKETSPLGRQRGVSVVLSRTKGMYVRPQATRATDYSSRAGPLVT